MARSLYGGRGGDYVINPDTGQVLAGAVGTVWTAKTGGTQVTDVLDENGSVFPGVLGGTIIADEFGGVRFQGPDGTVADLWVDFGAGTRVMIETAAETVAAGDVSGLGDAATLDVGTTTGTVAAGDHGHSGIYVEPGDLGGAATLDVGTGSGDVAAGDHAHSGTYVEPGDLGGAAVLDVGTGAGDVAAGDHGHGLGDAATKNVGTTAGTVAAGDDSRITGAVPKSTVTAKGSLIVASGSGTVAELGVGTNDYVLTADSAATNGVKWAAASGGSGIAATIFDAKGDLIAASAADTAARLAVGADGLSLVADSAQSSGLRWGRTAPLLTIPAANEYWGSDWGLGNASQSMTLDRVHFVPMHGLGLPIQSVSIRVNTAGSTGAVVRVGIYSSSSTTGRPDSLIVDLGTTSAEGTGVKAFADSRTLPNDVVWVAVVTQAVTSTLRVYSTVMPGAFPPGNNTVVFETPMESFWCQNSVSGALPSTATPALVNSTTSKPPVVGFRRAA